MALSGGPYQHSQTLYAYTAAKIADELDCLSTVGHPFDVHAYKNYVIGTQMTVTGLPGVLLGSLGNDVLIGDARDTSPGATITQSQPRNDVMNGYGGDDILDGGEGTDTLRGGGGSDILLGGTGADTLIGEAGDDTLTGGPGGDKYFIGLNEGADVVDDQGDGDSDSIEFWGNGVVTSDAAFHPVRDGDDMLITVAGSSGSIRIADMGTTTGRIERLNLLDASGATITSIDLVEQWALITQPTPPPEPPPPDPTPSGDPYAGTTDDTDIVNAGSGDDLIRGFRGWDVLYGNGGDDALLGGSGGTWTLYPDLSPITSGDELRGGSDNDLLVDDDPSIGLGGDYLDGGADDDILVFYGAPYGSSDTGDGGDGADMALVDLHDSAVSWNVSSGITRQITPSGSCGSIYLTNIESLFVLLGSGDDYATGGGGTDYLDSGAGNDHLDGAEGNDALLGGGGNDTLITGTGVDWIDGGLGNDTAIIDRPWLSQNLTFVGSVAASDAGFTMADGTFIKNVENFNLTTGSGDDSVCLSSDSQVGTQG